MVKPLGGPSTQALQTNPTPVTEELVKPKTQSLPNAQTTFTTSQETPSLPPQRANPSVSRAPEGAGTSLKFMTSQSLSQLPIGETQAAQPAPESRPALKPLTIGGSVGRGGQNRPEDVMQVKQALQATGYLPAGEVNGQVDASLNDAIAAYQRDNNLPVVDGRIDVSKYTMDHINRRANGQSTQPQGQVRTPVGPAPLPNLVPPVNVDGPLQPGPTDQPPVDNAPVNNVSPVAPLNGPADAQLAQLQARSVASAQQEWQNGVRESGGSNRGPRVDDYARAAQMRPGGEWCGFFTGFNYQQNGFKDNPSLASYQKARDYFMYRTYTSNTGSARNQQNDETRAQHAQAGSSRQYFMLPESPTRHRVTRAGSWGNQRYGHYNADANTFNYQNLPIRGGDTALFTRGHVGMVESYNPATGVLTTIEGNASGMGADGRRRSQAVVRKTYNLSDPAVRQQFDGFGRPSRFDFE